MSIPSSLYTYRAFGLTLACELDFPELFLSDDHPDMADVTVRMGTVPPKESIDGTQKPYTVYNATEFWCLVPGVAIYYVRNGREILIEPMGAERDELRLFFLSNALGAVLYQRDLIPLHASGVMDQSGGVYLFTAPSRTGKSTLLYGLIQLGYRPFTDDVCILKPAETEGKDLLAYAGYPMMKLWKETLAHLEVEKASELKRLRPQIEKFGLYFQEQFSAQPAVVKGIIILEADKDLSGICIERLSPVAAFKALESNVYRRHWVHHMGKMLVHFKSVSHWSNHLPVYLAKRPKYGNTVREFAETIHREILGSN